MNNSMNKYLDIFVSKEDMNKFLDFILNENSIYEISNFLKQLYNINDDTKEITNKDDGSNNYSSYYHPIMYLLYMEVISYDDIKDIISKTYDEIIAACNSISGYDSNNSIMEKNVFVRDKIRNIYWGRTDIKAYKDEANVKLIFDEILKTLTEEEKAMLENILKLVLTKIPKDEPSDSEDAGDDPSYLEDTEDKPSDLEVNFHKLLTRINDEEALIEKIIPSISWLYNSYTLDGSNILSSYIDSTICTDSNRSIFPKLLDSVFSKIYSRTINYE